MKKIVMLTCFALIIISIAGCGKVTNENTRQNQEQQKNALGLMSTSIAGAQLTADNWSWTQATPSANWSARHAHSSLEFNNKYWIIGGQGDSGQKNDVWYSSDGVNWTQATASAPWSPRGSHTSVVFNNKMWVIGGSYDKSDVWYSSDGVNWTQATASAPWGVRYRHASVVFDNKIWVIAGNNNAGGGSYGNSLNDVWYSSDGVNWTQATASAPWSPRDFPSAVVFDNKLWLMGGVTIQQSHNDVWYTTDGSNWTLVTGNAAWAPRYFHSSVVYDNKMWVIGGAAYEGNPSDIWYSSNGLDWTKTETTAPWFPRHYQSCVVFDNKIYMSGGSTTEPYKNDVWYMSKPQALAAVINIDPDTLNLKSKGNFITAYIELPEGYSVNDINIGSLKLNNTVPALAKPSATGDVNGNGVVDLMVKFDRQAVQGVITAEGDVAITITGTLADSTIFQGTDTISIINK